MSMLLAFPPMGQGTVLQVAVPLMLGICILALHFYTTPPGKSQSKYAIPLVEIPPSKSLLSRCLPSYLFYFLNAEKILHQAYVQYAKHGRTCQLPRNSFGTSIILPNKYLPWLVSQPEHVLNFNEWVSDTFQARWTLGHTRYVNDLSITHIQRVAIRVTSNSGIPAFQQELEAAMARALGDCQGWREIDPVHTCKMILLQATSRYIVGEPLCANASFHRWSLIFLHITFLLSEVLRLLPGFVRPLAGLLVSIPRLFVMWKLKGLLRPTFNARLQALQNDGSSTGDMKQTQHKDFLHQIMSSLYKKHSPDLNLGFVTTHVMLFVLAAVLTTHLLASHVLYDILASDKQYNTVAELQAELHTVLTSNSRTDQTHTEKHIWTRLETEHLPKLDSVLRESLRMNMISSQSLARKVLVDGLETPDGYLLRKGTTVTVLGRQTHGNEDIYPQPDKFLPWRHLGEEYEGDAGGQSQPQNQGRKRLVDTSPEYLAFGHGPRSCPGRFLLAAELKILLATLFQNYEMELPGGGRPASMHFSEFLLPPRRGRIRVKRASPVVG
ncbi:cytochrome P450 [Aspergillus unguis]